MKKPDLSAEIDFDTVVFKKGHISLDQYLQIHRYFIKRTHYSKTSDKFKLERRETMAEKDTEGYKFYVLSQLAAESDAYDKVVSELILALEGFTLD